MESPADNQTEIIESPVDNQTKIIESPADNETDIIESATDNETEIIESPADNETEEIGILMLSLDDAGKTTILYKLIRSDENELTTIPTIGFNVETVEFKGKKYTIWDVGCHPDVRILWKFYTSNKSAVIFVVDASNRERVMEAKEFLFNIMSNEELSNTALLVIANKQDKPNCISLKELEEQLDLKSIKQTKRIVECSAFDRKSLNDISNTLNDMNLCFNNTLNRK